MEHVEQTLSRIGDGSAVIGVVGLGYVGLPLVLGFAGRGFHVIGLDIDQGKMMRSRPGKAILSTFPVSQSRKRCGMESWR